MQNFAVPQANVESYGKQSKWKYCLGLGKKGKNCRKTFLNVLSDIAVDIACGDI